MTAEPTLYTHAFMRIPGAESIIDPIILADMETAVGVVPVAGVGYRVGVVSEGCVKQMSAMQAMRVARELDGEAPELRPFTTALRLVAKTVDEIATAMRSPGKMH